MRGIPLLIISLVYLICVPLSALSTTYYVNPGQSIQDAIDSSTHGDVVIVSPGTYYENIYFDGKNIVLTSTDPLDTNVVAATIIDGSTPADYHYGSVVRFEGSEDTTCVLAGFTIRNGTGTLLGAYYNGGGIYGNRCYAIIRNNNINGNSAEWYGGGLGSCFGTIKNNTISSNSAKWGGGLFDCSGTVKGNTIILNTATTYSGGGLQQCHGTIKNNIISSNQADYGGGLEKCHGTIEGNTIILNTANGVNGGGGLYDCDGVILNNVISENSTSNAYAKAGGLSCCGGLILNNNISKNSAGDTYGRGGGLYYCDGLLINNTITENTAGLEAGGFYYCYATIVNCVIWGNSPENKPQLVLSSTPSYSCIQDWADTANGNINSDPLFIDTAESNFRLQSSSPCIDSGYKFADAGEYDLDGNQRYVDASDSSGWGGAINAMVFDNDTVHLAWASIDMGAYEYQTACTPLKFTLQARDALDTGLWRDLYTGFSGTYSDTEAAGHDRYFYRVIGFYDVEQSIVGISAEDALGLLDERYGEPCFTVLDVRTSNEYGMCHIIGAVNINFYSPIFAAQLNVLDKGRTYLVYCGSGFRSGQAVQIMQALGFVEVYDLLGGMSVFQSIPGADVYLEP